MRIYLASRWDRAGEMCRHRDELNEMGIEVVAPWFDSPGGTEWSIDGEVKYGAREAQRDMNGIEVADLMVNFTEDPKTPWVRGDRHWECGYACAMGVDQLIVGPREIVFHCLPDVDQVYTWDQAKAYITQYRGEHRL